MAGDKLKEVGPSPSPPSRSDALARLHAPFDHSDWIYELKHDGSRALAYIQHAAARFVSRNGNTFKSFPNLTAAIGSAMDVRDAVLDGEIVHLGSDGRPLSYNLMRRRTRQHFAAFDLLWLDGRDFRGLPLLERKRRFGESFRRNRRRSCTWITSRGPAENYRLKERRKAGLFPRPQEEADRPAPSPSPVAPPAGR